MFGNETFLPAWNAMSSAAGTLSASRQALVATAQTVTTTAAFSNTTAAVSGVIGAGIASTHRQLQRYCPDLHEDLNRMAGYQTALLKPQTLDSLRYLIQTCKVDLNHNDQGYNALSAISQGGPDQTQRLQFLLCYSMDINSQAAKACDRTPLQLMITHGLEESVLFFINHARNKSKKIDFTIQDKNGNTALLLSIKMMQTDVALCIIEQNFYKVDIGLDLRDSKGRSALECAFILGQIHVFNALSKIAGQNGRVKTLISDPKHLQEPAIRDLLEERYALSFEEYSEEDKVIDMDSMEEIEGLEKECLKGRNCIKAFFSPAPLLPKKLRYRK